MKDEKKEYWKKNTNLFSDSIMFYLKNPRKQTSLYCFFLVRFLKNYNYKLRFKNCNIFPNIFFPTFQNSMATTLSIFSCLISLWPYQVSLSGFKFKSQKKYRKTKTLQVMLIEMRRLHTLVLNLTPTQHMWYTSPWL